MPRCKKKRKFIQDKNGKLGGEKKEAAEEKIAEPTARTAVGGGGLKFLTGKSLSTHNHNAALEAIAKQMDPILGLHMSKVAEDAYIRHKFEKLPVATEVGSTMSAYKYSEAVKAIMQISKTTDAKAAIAAFVNWALGGFQDLQIVTHLLVKKCLVVISGALWWCVWPNDH